MRFGIYLLFDERKFIAGLMKWRRGEEGPTDKKESDILCTYVDKRQALTKIRTVPTSRNQLSQEE